MKLRFAFVLVAILVFSMVAGSAVAAPAGPTNSGQQGGILLEPAGATGSALYIVQLSAPALASYYGGVESYAPTSPAVTGQRKLDMTSDASIAYMDYLDSVQAAMLNTIDQTLGRDVAVHVQWNVAYNGFAIEITPAEAAKVVALDGINIVQREFMRYTQTDVGPQWIGADNIWNGAATGTQYKGEGVIVGVVDTGINLGHPSFAATGQDGYVHTNPLGSGNYLGLCLSNPGTYVCTNKTYGFYIFTGEVSQDGDGHGSHTSSTSAGNYLNPGTVDLSPYNLYSPAISGVAPHANIIGYKACLDVGGCPGAALVSSINQATANGVDVINYSIGGGTSNPWLDADALAFLAAQDAGVVPVTSAGNSGPTPSTVGSPGDAPWMLTVGASTHNRAGINALIDMTGGNTTPPIDMLGKSFSTGTGAAPLPIVYAGNFGDALCLNPFTPGTFSGQIVVCDRGTNARVAKGYNVLQGGAGGMVLTNTSPSESLNGDVHWLPAVQLDSVQGTVLKAWLAGGAGHMGTIEGTTLSFDPANGDIMAGFSSRGPLVNNASDIIKPDVTAPGVDIIAAYRDLPPGPEDPTRNYGVVSGTSMSSPHTAGAAALLSGLYPNWTPAEIKAAMMSSGKVTGVYKEDYVTQADPFDMGAGRVQIDKGAQAGLLFNVAPGAFQAANPGAGGNPKTLNLASLGNDDCGGACTWYRTVEAVDDGTWSTSSTAAAGLTISVAPANFSLNAGETQVITVTANVGALPVGVWAFGQVNLTPSPGGSFVPQHLPLAVKPSSSTPIINVNPGSLSSTQAPNTSTQQNLNVGNVGTADLTWNIFEDETAAPELVDWSDNFDSYATGSQLHGQGGWKGWGNDPTFGALASSAQVVSAPNSAAIVGDSDLVHEYSGYTSGVWNYSAQVYVPTDFAGESYFILLNTYNDAGSGLNWSTQVKFQSGTDLVIADGAPGGQLPLIKGQWVPIRVEINLDSDTQTFFYDNQMLYTGSWTAGQTGGGALNIGAVDLYANGASVVYYDDMSLAATAAVCAAPDDIPWASVSPTNGVTAPAGSTPVSVTFNSTGLSAGTYNGTLCVASDDPQTPLVPVPLELTVQAGGDPNIDVNPLSMDSTQATNQSTNQPLTIANTGGGTLTWTIDEEDTTVPPFGNGNSTPDLASASDNTSDAPSGAPVAAPEGVTVWHAPEVVLFDNGSLVNSPGTGVGGADESVLQNATLLMNTLGFGHQILNNNWVADDFTVGDAGGWNVDTATFFAYQSGSSTASTMNGVNWIIYDGDPSGAGAVVASGSGLNSTAWSNIYRVTETTTGTATDRPIMASVTPVSVFLPQGTYWIAWQTGGTLGSGPWAPPITINSQTTTGNGLQSLAGTTTFAPALDTGTSTQQGFPFILEGTVGGGGGEPCLVPSDIPWLTLDATAGSNSGGTDTDVTVTFDSTGYGAGTYTGNLCVDSNDPDPGPGNETEQVIVPVTMTVEAGGDPNIFVDPLSMASTQATNTQINQTLNVANTGGGTLNWLIDEDNNEPQKMPPFVAGTDAASAGMAPNATPAAMPAVTRAPLGSNAYAWNSQNGPYYTVFDIDVPGTLPNIAAFPANDFVGAGEYYNGLVYMMDNTNTMFEVNPVTGAIVNQYPVTAPPGGETYSGMAVDPTTGTVYASSTNVATSSLFSIVPSTGVATLVGPLTGSQGMIAISFDGAGDLYGYDIVSDSMYSIDKTNGVIVNLGALPFDANFGQGMGYDPATDTVYLAAFNNGTFLAELYTYDTGANTYAFMGVLGSTTPGGLNQLSWLGFADGPPAEDCTALSDIPWLSLSPTNGANAGGTDTDVTVTFDSTGYGPGTYTGNLCVTSNDPDAGPGNETDLVIVPVEMIVEDAGRCPMGYQEVTLLTEGFDGSFPPAGWTVANTTTGCTGVPDWTNTDPGARGNLTGGTGMFAIADSDQCGSASVMNTEMWTSVLDMTGLTNPIVSYYTDYNDISAASDVGDLDFSTDGGATWTNLLSWNEDHRGPLMVEQPFAGDNQSSVLVRWNYTNATWDWWWQVDDVVVTACEPIPTAVTLNSVSASPAAPLAGLPLVTLPAAAAAALGAAFVWRRKRDQ